MAMSTSVAFALPQVRGGCEMYLSLSFSLSLTHSPLSLLFFPSPVPMQRMSHRIHLIFIQGLFVSFCHDDIT